jgi:hypothetical protein
MAVNSPRCFALSELQTCLLGPIPRALPWADMLRPLRGDRDSATSRPAPPATGESSHFRPGVVQSSLMLLSSLLASLKKNTRGTQPALATGPIVGQRPKDRNRSGVVDVWLVCEVQERRGRCKTKIALVTNAICRHIVAPHSGAADGHCELHKFRRPQTARPQPSTTYANLTHQPLHTEATSNGHPLRCPAPRGSAGS